MRYQAVFCSIRSLLQSLCIAAVLFSGSTAVAAPVFALQLLPADTTLDAPAGTTAGWGYQLTNFSDDYLVPVALTADLFDAATPWSLFDFPTVSPHDTVEVTYIPDLQGLYQLTWDRDATPGARNVGVFTIEALWFDADPLEGGVATGVAGSASIAYLAQVSHPRSVPEPATWWLVLTGLMLTVVRRSIKRHPGR